MRPDTAEVALRPATSPPRHRRAAAAATDRRALRRAALDALEPRTLMAVLPPPTVLPQVDITGQQGAEFSPSVAVDPSNPLHAVVVYSAFDPVNNQFLSSLPGASYTTDGGQRWTRFNLAPQGTIRDPNATAAPFNLLQFSAQGVQFDHSGGFYVAGLQFPGGYTPVSNGPASAPASGAVIVEHFAFGSSPSLLNQKVVDEFANADSVSQLTLAVDAGTASFTDPDTQAVQADPFAGNVYVAWVSNDTAPANVLLPNTFYNPNRILVSASSDGGRTYTNPAPISDGGNFTSARNSQPTLTVSQGTADGTTAPGQLTVAWVDAGTLATANPPTTLLKTDRITDGGTAAVFPAAPGPINDAAVGPNSTSLPAVTDFPIQVNIADPKFLKVSDLAVTLSLVHPNLNELSVVLIPPTGSGIAPITLFQNQTDSSGNTNAFGGISGANLGIINGQPLGTTFDDSATRDIVDIGNTGNRGAGAPFIGHFRPEVSSLDQGVVGKLPAGVNGTWTLELTDFRNSGATVVQNLVSATLNFRSGMDAGPDVQVVSFVTAAGPLTNSPGVTISPAPVLASDNTLGSFSPHQGRLYLAFAARRDNDHTPIDNTDIFLWTSDNSGQSWQPRFIVNDDVATADGFSEGNPNLQGGGTQFTGRAQFQPQLAVDQSTGTLVASYLDTRYSADRNRFVDSIATSIDGGATFGASVYAESKQTATDAATGKAVALGPIPENFTATANGVTNQTLRTGDRQGLAVAGGRVYPVYVSNRDAKSANPTIDAGEDIRVSPTLIGVGPRIIDSTMGVVGQPGDAVNGNRTADGTPIAQSFVVTFDRPVDPATFGPDDVRVFFRDTLPGNPSGGPVPVIGVTPLAAGSDRFGPTEFRVDFAPRSAVGTYSYTVGPNISDRIRSVHVTVTTNGPTTTYTAVAPQVPKPFQDGPPNAPPGLPHAITSTITVAAPPTPQVVARAVVNLTINYAFTGDLVIFLIAPDGTRVQLVNEQPFQFGGDGNPNGGFVNTTFDDAAAQPITAGTPPYTGSFQPQQPFLDVVGLNPTGTWSLEVDDLYTGLTDARGTLQNWSLTLQTGTRLVNTTTTAGTLMDQNANGTPGEAAADIYAVPRPLGGVSAGGTLQAPFDPLTLPLIIPGPSLASAHVADTSPPTATAATGTQVGQPIADNGVTTVSTLRVAPISGRVVGSLSVSLSIAHPRVSDLVVDLVSPDGTIVRLVQNQGSGANFTGTTFSDSAAAPIAPGGAPYTGTFRPFQALSAFAGQPLAGVWTLRVTDTVAGNAAPATLDAFSLSIKADHAQTFDNLVLDDSVGSLDVSFDRDMDPTSITPASVLRVMGPLGPVLGPYTVTPLPGVGGNTDPSHPRAYRIGFAVPLVFAGTYTVQLDSAIKDKNGDALDTNQNAGLDLLRGTSQGKTAAVSYNSTDTPAAIPDLARLASRIVVPDNFVVAGLTLTVNIQHPRDTDLQAYLLAPDGVTKVQLFTHIGANGTGANFTNTTFDDNATTLIQNGGPPFNGTFKPQQGLSTLTGRLAAGTYTLVIQDDASGLTGTLLNWTLTLQQPLASSGLGEIAADRATASFRIFTLDPTNPIASSTWTAVGPAPISGSGNGPEASAGANSGRVGGLALDPSDPSGNTVYVAGASGGVWRSNNFLNPGGPTYVPLTDFGPTTAINIGGVAVFGRNNDPNQSIVVAGTGEADTGTPGVGFLLSQDGGASWSLLDSTDNSLPFAQRDHLFSKNGGSSVFKVVVDPKPTPSGGVILYAALSGGDGGLWRSLDTGAHWQNMRPGQATDVVLDPGSGTGTAGGNLQILYASFRGEGVYSSPNQGVVLNLMIGGVGNPLIHDVTRNNPVAVTAPTDTPNGAKGRIVLAKPALTGNLAQDLVYSGWLYAAVIETTGHENGLYLTKDFGQNWTKLLITTLPPSVSATGSAVVAIPTNDSNPPNVQYDIGGGPPNSGLPPQGNYDVSLAVDPTNPNITYLGGTADGQPTGFIRVDATRVSDPHNLVAFNANLNDGGALSVNSQGSLLLDDITKPAPNPYLNFIRDPFAPFVAGATLQVANSATFTNTGGGVTWTPFDIGGTDQHRILTFKDPATGRSRIVIGDDQGVFTALDIDGKMVTHVGSNQLADGSRNGNLQITQLYYGAIQPSILDLNGQIRQSLIYGSAQDNGGPQSSGDILSSGNIQYAGAGGDATGVATDQQGVGTVYQYFWPCCGGNRTDFFQVNGVGRTNGLLQSSIPGPTPDPQWPSTGGSNFAVNPLTGQQVIISSQAGRVFGTENQGLFWNVIGNPGSLDGTYAPALAYGAPLTVASNNLDAFLYAGTSAGNIFVTQTGGGGSGNAWTKISGGLDGSTIQRIITSPDRGSHEAYAVTSFGVYHIADSLAAGATWTSVTGNLFSLTHAPFGVASQATPQLFNLTSIVADWRYALPDGVGTTTVHPLLYVAGQAGVFRSVDGGQSWSLYPAQDPGSLNTTPTPPGDGGGLPMALVTDLGLSLGNIDPTNGRPIVSTGPNLMLATTYGRGQFVIRLAPYVVTADVRLDPALPAPGGSDSGSSATDRVTNVLTPVFDGLSEESAFGNLVQIILLDETDPAHPRVISDPAHPTYTDNLGRFQVQVAAGAFAADGSTDGVKTIGVQAVNASGTHGNIALLTLTLDTIKPLATNAPMLLPSSDTGLSQTDNITKQNKPTFAIGGPGAEAATIITLYRDGVAVATRTGAGNITDPGPVADGVHVYNDRQVDLAGNVGPLSASTSITVDTVAPARPPSPTLLPADDSGTLGDNITNVASPRLFGSAEPNGLILLIDASGTVVGQSPVDAKGNYTVQPSFPLSNGTYALRVEDEDIAGNISTPSLSLTLTIQATPPAAPTISLVQADDSGTVGDGITNVVRPRLTGNATPGLLVDILDVRAFAYAGPALPIPDNAGQAAATLDVESPLYPSVAPGLGTVIAGVTVTVNITHPRTSDLELDLVSPSGTTVVLALNRGVGANFINTTFSDRASLPIAAGVAPFGGTYRPEQPLSALVGRSPAGVWTLVARDTVTGQLGTINSFALSVSTVLIPAVPAAESGTYLTKPLADLPPLTYSLEARASDLAGNSSLSAPLALTILTGNPAAPSTLFLNPADATGVNGGPPPAVARTTVRRPRLDGVAPANTIVELVSTASPNFVLATTRSDAAGNYVLQLPNNLNNGTIVLQAFTVDAAGNQSKPALSPQLTLVTYTEAGDYTGDGKADLAALEPFLGRVVVASSNPTTASSFLSPAQFYDVPLPGDYDGDGKTDVALYRPSIATWIIQRTTAGPETVQFGQPGVDIPVPGDYDGDGTTDLAVYRPTTGQWFVLGSKMGPTVYTLGAPNLDRPIPADYDGDGKTDIAVFRPTTATWYINNSSGGQTVKQFGQVGLDVPVPADYDGDRKADFAVYRPNSGQFLVLLSGGGVKVQTVGNPNTDIPVPADYTGDGKADLAVYRPSTGIWTVIDSTTGAKTTTSFGSLGDIPVMAPYAYKNRQPVQAASFGGGGGGLAASSFNFASTASGLAAASKSKGAALAAAAPARARPAQGGESLSNGYARFRRS